MRDKIEIENREILFDLLMAGLRRSEDHHRVANSQETLDNSVRGTMSLIDEDIRRRDVCPDMATMALIEAANQLHRIAEDQ